MKSNAASITTTGFHGLVAGNTVRMELAPYSLRQRFFLWLRKPWAWPPKRFEGTFVVGSVTNNEIR